MWYRKGSCGRGMMMMPWNMMMAMMCGGAGRPAGMTETPVAAEEKDILDTAAGAGGFQTLLAALRVASLVEALKGEGPFTVFAPGDTAFARLAPSVSDKLFEPDQREQLRRILQFHVVLGRLRAADLAKQQTIKTLSGDELVVSFDIRGQAGPEFRARLAVGDAKVLKADLLCTNGVIHVIDRVLLPKA